MKTVYLRDGNHYIMLSDERQISLYSDGFIQIVKDKSLFIDILRGDGIYTGHMEKVNRDEFLKRYKELLSNLSSLYEMDMI